MGYRSRRSFPRPYSHVRRLLADLASDEGEGEMRIPLRPQAYVEDVMRGDVLVVSPDTPPRAIAERMAAERFHRVLVMEDGELLGIVTSLDLLAYFATEER